MEIAVAAGVSVPTVSKVLNQRSDVAPETRKRVEEVISARGYTPSRAARALGSGQSGQIDLVVPVLDSGYILEIIRGVEDTLNGTGRRLVLSASHDDVYREQKWVSHITDSSTDGALLLLPREGSAYLEYVQQHETPFVVIDDRDILPSTVASVSATNWVGGLTATEHLIALHHRRIAIICGPATYVSTKARLAGYRTACENAGIPLDPDLIRPGDFQPESGYTQTCELLKLPDPPTAIFACSDTQAAGVYRALYTHRYRVPDDISVVGFDDVPFTSLLCPTLTSVRQPLFEMGRVATNILTRLIDGETLDGTRIELTTDLIIRESTASRI